jgi:regulator of cell morphogenesis and NO signaling
MKESSSIQTTITPDRAIGEIVADDYRTAKVFEKYGIDFCCGGKAALAATCTERGIELVTIMGELEALKSESGERSLNFATWDLPFLADYIVNVHHSYIKENNGQILDYANKIAAVHGAKHPEVIKIATIFDKIAIDLAPHLKEEEGVLFPIIKRVDATKKAGASPESEDIEKIDHLLKKLVHEHEEIGDAVHTIRQLAKDYSVPDDVCNTFMVTYQKLKEFEDDLHKHVHLENNILFLKAAHL